MLAMVALLALVIVVPSATAQEMMDDSMMMEDTMMTEQPKMMEMPKAGGMVAPSTLVLPAAGVLLLGSGLVAYGVRRRRR